MNLLKTKKCPWGVIKMNEMDWLSNRQDIIEKNMGKWVVIDMEHKRVFAHEDLDIAVKEFKEEHPDRVPFIFKIPREDEDLILL